MNSLFNQLMFFSYTPGYGHSAFRQFVSIIGVTLGNLGLLAGYAWIVLTVLGYVGYSL